MYDELIGINFDKNMHTKRENNMYLSDNQIEILRKYNINYSDYNNIEELIYKIEAILNQDYSEELDRISSELSEYNYYNNTNK